MTDDPREILKAAGVECAEVDEYFDDGKHNFMLHGAYGVRYIRESKCDTAILAVSRIASQLASDKSDCQEAAQRANEAAFLANQDNERLRGEVAQYKWQRDECADELGRKLAVGYKYEATKPFAAHDVIVDLNRRWDEHNA